MSVTIGSTTLSRLTVQPYGYEETGTRDGLTAQKWLVTGLCTNTEWTALLGVYDAWRDLRIEDPDTLAANTPAYGEPPLTEPVLGATVDLTVTANGMTWNAIPCWFIQAPSGEQVGAYVQATVELVDAAQAVEVLLREREKNQQAEDLPELGTFNLGGAVIKLTKPPDTFQDIPQMQVTASGYSYISGPLRATKVKDIQGTTDSDGWAAIQVWYADTTNTPLSGSYFPLSAPTASAKNTIVEGKKVIEYTVSVVLGKVR